MLFLVKRRFWPALATAVAFALLAIVARHALGLNWNGSLRAVDLACGAVAGLALAGSDGALQALLTRIWGERYLSRYRALVEVFRQQRAPQIAMGGVLAAAEELVFRGVMLEWLLSATHWPTAVAWVATAAAFAVPHVIPDRKLAPFVVWAFWEGLLLNGVYIWSGSLAVSALVHAAHDICGFSVFAWQRRTGWGLTPPPVTRG